MNNNNNNRNPQGGRRRRYQPPSVGTMVSTAVVAYGVYRLGNWAWNSFLTNEQEEEIENQDYEENHHHPSSSSPSTGNNVTKMLRNVVSGGKKQQSRSSSSTHHHRRDHSQNQQQQRQHWKLRRQRLERCRYEAMKAMDDFLPTLENILEKETSTKNETQCLKKLRLEKQQWQDQHNDSASVSSDCEEEEEEDNNRTALERIRQEEKELWNSIKVKTFTRVVSTAYAHTILFLVLTVQVHLLGGRLFEEHFRQAEEEGNAGQQQEQQQSHTHTDGEEEEGSKPTATTPEVSASNQMASYQTSHKMVLQHTYEYFFDHGLSSLVRCVKRAVETVLMDWDVMDPKRAVSEHDIEDVMVQIRDIVEGRRPSSRSSPTRSWRHGQRRQQQEQLHNNRHYHSRSILKFLLPPEHDDYTILLDDMAQYILDETWDLMESPVMQDAQSACLHTTFHHMQESYWSHIFLQNPPQQNQNRSPTSDWIVTTKPLANVITQMKHTFKSFFMKPPTNDETEDGNDGLQMFSPQPSNERLQCNMYCSILASIPTVLELGDVSFN